MAEVICKNCKKKSQFNWWWFDRKDRKGRRIWKCPVCVKRSYENEIRRTGR